MFLSALYNVSVIYVWEEIVYNSVSYWEVLSVLLYLDMVVVLKRNPYWLFVFEVCI